jgi:peptidylprolyl isomerase
MKRLAAALLGLLLAAPALRAAPAGDGLFARFQTTEGVFWVQLEFQKAPRTVANFISLAEGTRDWVDFRRPSVARRPFYPGIIFHRVIQGFMIQGGSPNSRGTDGPGYQFNDEFHADLRHAAAGTLSMANSGADSNGSQFFITLTNTPWLDNRHSVFGRVVEGLDVVFAVGAVPVGANDKPVTDVVIQAVEIVRRGAAALAFDPAQVTPPLPVVSAGESRVHLRTNNVPSYEFKVNGGFGYYTVYGQTLTNWNAFLEGFGTEEATASFLTSRYFGTNSPGFFQLFRFTSDLD